MVSADYLTADVDGMRALAARLRHMASAVKAERARLRTKTEVPSWKGHAATYFHRAVKEEMAVLDEAVEQLSTAAEQLSADASIAREAQAAEARRIASLDDCLGDSPGSGG